MKIRLILFCLLCIQIASDAQRIFPAAIPVAWTERESNEELNDAFVMQRIFPYGKADVIAHKNGVQDRIRQINSTRITTATNWNNVGPLNIGGRLTDVEMPSSSLTTIYVCSASGGIFKSDDKGLSWLPIFDAQPTLSIGDLAIAPSNANILYAGTGESNAGGGSLTYDGNGVYKSTDAGSTWTSVGLDSTRNTGRIAVHPTNPDIVYAATMGDLFENNSERGLYKSTNGGLNWQNVLSFNDSTGVVDVAINPVHSDTVYACSWTRVRRIDRRNYGGPDSQIWRSYNGGVTWTNLTNGLPSGFDFGRTCVGIAKSQPNIVYVMISDKQSTFQGVYRSTDYGDSFTRTNDAMLGDIFNGAAHWEGRITVDPTNPDNVFLIGFDTWNTTDGGQNWFDVTQGLHPDNHEVFINPLDHNFVLRANDAGLFVSDNGGSFWTHAENLPVTQLYTCEVDERFPNQYGGGAQDNGVNVTFSGVPDNYSQIWGGDGFYLLIDPFTSDIITESQYGNVSSGNFGIDTALDRFNWNTPLEFNHQNTNSVFMGAQRLYKSTDKGAFWNAISPDLTNHNLFGYPITWGTITTVSNAPSDSSVSYCGTDDGQVWVTRDDGASWTNINPSTAVRWITRVTTDPNDAAIVYCTISGYRFHDNVAHVYRSVNFGNTWQNIEGNLPNVPCNDIIPDPYRDSTLFLATDIGTYITYDLGQNWIPLGSGMPIVPVTDLRLHRPSMTLIAATYGRSIYTLDLGALYVSARATLSDKAILEIFPNPAQEKFSIQFYSPTNSKSYIFISDMNGRTAMKKDIIIQAGNNNFSFQPSLAPGVYSVLVNVNDKMMVRKLVIR